MTHTPCIRWEGKKDNHGYGRIYCKGKNLIAHREEWEIVNGKIPEGMVLDHLCRVRDCINLEHLEIVTPAENTMRGFGACAINARKEECTKGHSLDSIDKRGHRQCSTCRRKRWSDYRKRKISSGVWVENKYRKRKAIALAEVKS